MTAFARVEKHASWGHAIWELRSVNHRYLEISLYLPDTLSHLEPFIRKYTQTHLQRGKIEARLRYKPPTNNTMCIEINETLAKSLIHAYRKIACLTQTTTPLNPAELLHWPQLLEFPDIAYETLQPKLMDLFADALNDLCAVRKTEGQAILSLITQRLTTLNTLVADIRRQFPHILAAQRDKLLARLAEAKVNLDPNRLEQEMLLLTQKMDIAEELDRLQLHLNEFKNILEKNKKAQGKQLDFLLQELNREANTLASKSLHAGLTLTAVNIKVLIEEIREQVQNIE